MRRSVAAVVAAVTMAVGGFSHAAEDFAALTNRDRTRSGLPALTGASDLQAFAQRRAEEMARAGQLSHTENLAAQITNWRRLAENVGRGPTLADIESQFMASAVHRENILARDFTEFGAGVVWDGVERFYVAVIFRQPRTATTVTTAAAAPAPAPRVAAIPPARPKPRAIPTATASPATTAPPPAPEPPPPPVEPPAPVVREAGLRLHWVLRATAGDPAPPPARPAAPAADAAAAPGLVAAASIERAAGDGAAPGLLVAIALLGVVGTWMGALAEARRRLLLTAGIERRFEVRRRRSRSVERGGSG